MDATSKSGDAGLRYCLLLFNFILVVSGLLVIGFLLLALHHHAVAGYAYTASVGLILLVGGLTFLVGVMACFVAIHPTRRMLLLFGLVLLGIILVEVIGFFSFTTHGGTNLLNKALEDEFEEAQWHGNNLEAIFTVDAIQRKHSCCGYRGIQEYGSHVPASCCSTYPGEEGRNCYQTPCLFLVNRVRDRMIKFIGGAAAAYLFTEVFGVWVAFFFARRRSKENNVISSPVYTVLK